MNSPNEAGAFVVLFAVPDESRLFTKTLANRRVVRGNGRQPLPTIYGEIAGRSVMVVHTGIGDSQAAQEHVTGVLAGISPPPRLVISAGYAGALAPDLRVGDLVLGENWSDEQWLDEARACLAGEPFQAGAVWTQSHAAETACEKEALQRRSGALAVDMETAWIWRICDRLGLPFLSLRIISDAADQDFPVPGRVLYDAVRQRPRYLALPAWLAMHPAQIAPFVRFVRGLGPARVNLTRALRTVLARL